MALFSRKKKKTKKAKTAPTPPVASVTAPPGDDFFEFEGATTLEEAKANVRQHGRHTEHQVIKQTTNPDKTVTIDPGFYPPGHPLSGKKVDPEALTRKYGIHRAPTPPPDTLLDKVANVFTRRKKKVSGVVAEGAKSIKVVGKVKQEDFDRCLDVNLEDSADELLDLDL